MQTETAKELAQTLIQRYGTQAQAVATARVSELRAAGDEAGQGKWQRVLDYVCELRRAGQH